MRSLFTMEATLRRMRETEAAIAAQRAYVDGLTDPEAKAVARRTLATLEDILVIVQRTHLLLLAATRDPASSPVGPADGATAPRYRPRASWTKPAALRITSFS